MSSNGRAQRRDELPVVGVACKLCTGRPVGLLSAGHSLASTSAAWPPGLRLTHSSVEIHDKRHFMENLNLTSYFNKLKQRTH